MQEIIFLLCNRSPNNMKDGFRLIRLLVAWTVICYLTWKYIDTLHLKLKTKHFMQVVLLAIWLTMALHLVRVVIHKREAFTIFGSGSQTKGMINQNGFWVRDQSDAARHADMLMTLDSKAQALVQHAMREHGHDSRIQKLASRFKCCGDLLQELPWEYEGEVAVSLDKGSSIGLCIDKKNDMNMHMYVVIHEMAHLMSDKYENKEHSIEFWKNMAFLENIAIRNNVYKPQDFEREPISHCGMRIDQNNKHGEK